LSAQEPRRRRRAPTGWAFVTTTQCGAPVYTPRDPKRRREFFEDCIAYVDRGCVWVRSKTAWLRDARLRRHEERHLAQAAWLGEHRFKLLYWACSHLGYRLNPFEIAARAAEAG
jgi:hypothetical protein